MSVPQRNQVFQQGEFQGYRTYGICRIAKSFSTFQEAHVYQPVRGEYFALLDDPKHIDGDGVRTPRLGDPPAADTSRWVLSPDADNRTTLGVDGAILECADMTIEAGQALWFHWAFARFDWSPANDFAMFAAFKDGDTEQTPGFKVCLAQSIELERQNRWYTDWQVFSWRPAERFQGTIQWIVSNGMSTSLPLPRPGGGARPSALLIDCVDLD